MTTESDSRPLPILGYQEPGPDLWCAPMPQWLTFTTCVYPIGWVASFYLIWFTAWSVLGHVPRPSWDDPKDVGWTVDLAAAPFAVLTLGMGLAIVAALFACVAAVGQVRMCPSLRASACRTLVSLVVVWAGCLGFVAWDPLLVMYWLLD